MGSMLNLDTVSWQESPCKLYIIYYILHIYYILYMRDTKLSKQLVIIIQFFTQAKHEIIAETA